MDLHAVYGGRRQGGIGPSRVTPNVLLFSDPLTGHKHGYFDGWGDDDCYHYAGEGQLGDQKMTQGNLSILNHRQDGRALRLFRGVSSGVCEYLGEFTLATHPGWYLTDAPETGNGPVRSVIMFRLSPVTAQVPADLHLPYTPPSTLVVDKIDVEQQNTERSLVDPAREPYEAERRESTLVRGYVEHLRLLGHTVCRQRITPAGELKPLFTDVFDETADVLIEAKGTVTREAIRMAVGQLLDYRRHLAPGVGLAILLPSRPRQDLIDFCAGLGIATVWPKGETYVTEGASTSVA
ncbi:restriction endonuclease [Streptomyces sp. SL13]|uniref:Restriction endonuclease n=1 Tax=Streptantibioticus silvisoli TaxID=2705255 RepID=A0AA90JZZ5_9ACTN|nr:restriction endonuclease [Streptantibioticus silvisoli]MDI5972566.1 restriction endonuclease [Streptantibioticus silvisoli]